MRRRATTVLLGCASLLWAPPAARAQRAGDMVMERAAASRARGVQNAPLLVYEIADFQCPYCARFSKEIFPLLDSAYVRPGRVQWVFVNLPLPAHRHAWAAAEAALCAGGLADRFWALHDRLFAAQGEWAMSAEPIPHFLRYAREAGVPVDTFQACILEDAVAPLLLSDVLFSAASRVGGTPTFIVGEGQVVVGLKAFEEWKELLEKALQAKKTPSR
ncbi:MAG: thioredoxin domain-containing protein [Gemmatimonadetes bacterium]|nr:thioredoxin domain-containing protein [Gemmatimonadota bacterium]